jgi:hypothetical protein
MKAIWLASTMGLHVETTFRRLRWLVAARKVEFSFARFVIFRQKAGFNPDQPRDELGRWTDTGSNNPRVLSDATPDNDWKPGAQYAQNNSGRGYLVDLREEEQLGGHPVAEHVGKSQSYLSARVRDEAVKIIERGDDFRGLGISSFSSLESANKLVNSTIAQNSFVLDRIARGELQSDFITARFSAPTGYEAYLSTLHSTPYRRDTYGVGVVVLRDTRVDRGWRVQSAFPQR